MSCVILPSETARLVYGYLVKENLNEIALQFLEGSPYLNDCCQIVKSGYQFNTKLMGKDLQDLLQEYSVIHNLVNSKVSLLCKSSLLYKRIKLKCESLAEILELILFWKYKTTKNDENILNQEKNEKNPKNQAVNVTVINSDNSTINNSNNNNNNYCNIEYLNNSEVTNTQISSIAEIENTCFTEGTNNSISLQKNNKNISEDYGSKLCCETYVTNEEIESQRSQMQIETNEISQVETNTNKEETPVFIEMCKMAETREINVDNPDIVINNTQLEGKISSDPDILSDAITNETPNNLEPSEEASGFESQMKIVDIERENQNSCHSLGIYSKSLGNGEGNMELENSSVVFVDTEVGNVKIDQEKNQIIVIPIEYYKEQDEMANHMEISNNLNEIEKNSFDHQKNELIFEGITTGATPQLYTDKTVIVDKNILTEKDFLKNKHLMCNIEKELKKQVQPTTQALQPLQETKGNNLHPVSAPLIVVSQSVASQKSTRYRTILPKEVIHPIVTIPLLEKNKDLVKLSSFIVEPKPREEKFQFRKAGFSRKPKKKKIAGPKLKAKKIEKQESLSMPSIKSPVLNRNNGNNSNGSQITILPAPEDSKIVTSERVNEEKENLEKTENEKIETPVFVMKKNSKRLSLSTPRRKSHIRALEFETPPKTSEERKKSRTSPKVKIAPVIVERKSVRNTLFKSPVPETVSVSPTDLKENSKTVSSENSKSVEAVEPLNELSIPIATRSPNTKLSEAWEHLTGVGCVIGQSESSKTSPKKMWDADLRCFISENNQTADCVEKKRLRKPEKCQKDNRKTTKKKVVSTKKINPSHLTVSPSKMSLTAKRNTYSINGNEEGSPIRSLLDDLKIVTPFKDIETIRPTEETPLTKLLRENLNTIDIDLSMINTPSFPPTPSIVITPDLDDVSLTGTNYYSPTKDCSNNKVLKITDYFKVDPEKADKKESKEMHEKVIGDLVSKAKEIIGIGRENQEEDIKKRPSGKILSMVKIQMLTQCDKKLCENIPINEESEFSNNFTNQSTLIGSLNEDPGGKSDLKEELEEKRKRALKKIKVVKENLSQPRNRVTKRGRKRKRSGNTSCSEKSKTDISNEAVEEKQTSESDENLKGESGIFHSTPYPNKKLDKVEKLECNKKLDNKMLEDIRQEFPSFQNDVNWFPELTEKSRKKLYYVECFLKLPDILQFLAESDDQNSPRLYLKPSLRRFFQVFYKWLKHPHKRELNASVKTKALLEKHLSVFNKINIGLNQRNKKLKKEAHKSDGGVENDGADTSENHSINKLRLSDDEEKDWARKHKKRKDEEPEDGVVSTLPLKKRKSTVQQVEIKTAINSEKEDSKNSCAENISHTQNFLQDIDVDRFLSQIHGQENR